MGSRSRPQILFGQMPVRSSFSKNGLTATATGATEMSIEIPAVGVSVIFNGQVFQARLSYSRFSYNTEGQCGEQGPAGRLLGERGAGHHCCATRPQAALALDHLPPPQVPTCSPCHLPRQEAVFHS